MRACSYISSLYGWGDDHVTKYGRVNRGTGSKNVNSQFSFDTRAQKRDFNTRCKFGRHHVQMAFQGTGMNMVNHEEKETKQGQIAQDWTLSNSSIERHVGE